MYMQRYTFSNRCAPFGSDLEAVCVCPCVNMLTHVRFPCAKPLSITGGGRANISMIHFTEQHFLFIHTPKKQATSQSSYSPPELSVLFFHSDQCLTH